jgi:hypothetical protein
MRLFSASAFDAPQFRPEQRPAARQSMLALRNTFRRAPMKFHLIAVAAAALGVAGGASAAPFPAETRASHSIVAKAGCWDECEDFYEAVEEAREEASEAAEESEDAEDREDAYRPGRAERRTRAVEHPAREKAAVPTKRSTRAARAEERAEPAVPPAPKKEKTAEPPAKSDVAVNDAPACKQYAPAVGMVISVACE